MNAVWLYLVGRFYRTSVNAGVCHAHSGAISDRAVSSVRPILQKAFLTRVTYFEIPRHSNQVVQDTRYIVQYAAVEHRPLR